MRRCMFMLISVLVGSSPARSTQLSAWLSKTDISKVCMHCTRARNKWHQLSLGLLSSNTVNAAIGCMYQNATHPSQLLACPMLWHHLLERSVGVHPCLL